MLAVTSFILIVVLLGVNYVAVKFSNNELEPFWGASFRFFIASSILFAIIGIKKIGLPAKKELLAAVLYGLLLFGATYGFLYVSLLSVSSGTSSVIFATIPLTTIIIASIVGLEKITARGLLGALIVVTGIFIVFSEQLKLDVPILSLILVFIAVITATLSGIVVKFFPKIHPISFNAVGMIVGALLLFTLSMLKGETLNIPALSSTWIALAWLVMSTIVAFILFVWLIGQWNASRASYTGVLPALVTIPVASILIGETIGLTFLAGTFLVLIGVYIGALSHNKGTIEKK